MQKTVRRLLRIDFVRFCVVGASGFVINATLLFFLTESVGLRAGVAQLIAAEVALFSNFIFHHTWTYKRNNVQKTIPQLIVQFHATSWAAVLGSALIVDVTTHQFGLSNFVALVISSLTVLFWNFGWSRYVIWRKQLPKEEAEES